MTRMLSVFLLLASGCIIYEEDWSDGECRACETPTDTSTLGNDGGDETDDPEVPDTDVPDPGPIVTSDLELSVGSAYPGDALLSSLVAVSGKVDLASVATVGFERDVKILDQLDRPGEIVLLLSVADDAEPGEVDVFVETKAGDGLILAAPFVVLTPTPSCNPGGGNGGTGDTGCP